MDADWSYVKATTLWPYETLLRKLQAVVGDPLVREAYPHTLPAAAAYLQRLILPEQWSASDYWPRVAATFVHLGDQGVQSCADLVARVATRDQCTALVAAAGIPFEHLVDVLACLFRWILPFPTATRELVVRDNAQEHAAYMRLVEHRLRLNLDLLRQGRCRADRAHLAAATAVPEAVLTALVHRADIARLPYVRRKTILPLCGAGYATLAQIATATVPELESALGAYFQRTRGKPWSAYRSVIVVRGLIRGAQALPPIVAA